MKASELIAALQKLIDEHGDLPVLTYNYDFNYGEWVEFSGQPRAIYPYPEEPTKKSIGI